MNLNTANTNQHLSTKLCDINNLNSLPPSVSNFAAMAFLKKYVPIHVYQLKKSIYMLIVRTKK